MGIVHFWLMFLSAKQNILDDAIRPAPAREVRYDHDGAARYQVVVHIDAQVPGTGIRHELLPHRIDNGGRGGGGSSDACRCAYGASSSFNSLGWMGRMSIACGLTVIQEIHARQV